MPLSPFAHNASRPVLYPWPDTYPCKPSFMIIGAPKCGSTSLFKYLEAHPDVRQPLMKELCYFSSFKRYLTRYRASPVTDWGAYVSAFAGRAAARGTSLRRRTAFADLEERTAQVGPRNQTAGRVRRELDRVKVAHPSGIFDACRKGRHVAFEGCPFYLHEHLAASQIHATFPRLRTIAVLRNPRERSVSAFNDYVRMGRIHVSSLPADKDRQLRRLIEDKIGLLRRGERSLEDFDMRILTSAVYIHGLSEWGRIWPAAQLLVFQSESMFEDAEGVLHRVQDFLGLTRAIPPSAYGRVHNKNTQPLKARASPELNAVLDAFFAPYNEQLYAWMDARNFTYHPWPNATVQSTNDNETVLVSKDIRAHG